MMNALREGMALMDTEKTLVRPLVAPRMLAPNPFLLPRSASDPPSPWRRQPRPARGKRIALVVAMVLAATVGVVVHASPTARGYARGACARAGQSIATHAAMLVRGEP